jgi:hypothetical protein
MTMLAMTISVTISMTMRLRLPRRLRQLPPLPPLAQQLPERTTTMTMTGRPLLLEERCRERGVRLLSHP